METNFSDGRVCCPVGDIIQGPRTLSKRSCPWKQTAAAVEILESVHAYRLLLMLLLRKDLICGTPSGINLKGLVNFLQKAKEIGELYRYAEPTTEEISRIFVF